MGIIKTKRREFIDHKVMRIKTKLLVAVLSVCTICNFVLAQDGHSQAFSIDRDKLTVSYGDKSLLQYSYRSVPAKPYVKRLTTPGGVNILRDAPHDHPHHHGLMFAVKVNDTGFWHERVNFGLQLHRSFQEVDVSGDGQNSSIAFTDNIDWVTPDSKNVLLEEKRDISLTQSDNATVLTWRTVLKTSPGLSSVKIGGSVYYGLGMRFVKSMDNNGTFINAAGKEREEIPSKDWFVVSAKWCAYQSAVDGKPVTVAMFDHPKNFRPVTWFTMQKKFSYLSATVNYRDNPFVLKSKDELSLSYGVALWDGKQNKEVIEKAYQNWIKSRKPDLLVRGAEWAGGKGSSDSSPAQTDTKASTLDQAEAWSFFPFCIGAGDSKKRTLAQQATMLKELGYEGSGYNNMRLKGIEERAKTLSDEGLRLFQVYFRVHLNESETFDEKRLAEFLPSLKPHKTQLALIIKGAKPSDRRLDDKAVAIIKRIADMARPYGVTVVFYHHGAVWLETCSDGVRIAKKVNRPGEVGAMFNLWHWMRRDKNRDLRSVLEEAQPWLMAVSINGTDTPEKMYARQEEKAVVPLDESIYDLNEILDILRDIKYSGPIGMQCHGIRGDARLHLERSMGVWKRLSKKKKEI